MLREARMLSKLSQELTVGDRVRMSQLGCGRHPKYRGRQGVIVGKGSPSSWRVKFDGRKSAESMHRDYLEKAD